MSRYFDNKELFAGPTTKQYGSHMVTTNVIKETKVKYINIDSRFRDEYTNSNLANYYFTLPERINDVKNISVCNIELPLSIFNVSPDLGNNHFSVIVSDAISSSNYNVDVSSGFYELSPFNEYNPLRTVMNNALVVAGVNTLAIDFANSYNNGFDYNNNNNDVNTYNGFFTQMHNTGYYPLTVNFAVTHEGTPDKYNIKSKFGWMLGFHNMSYTIPPDGRVCSDSFVNLNTPRYVYLVIDEFNGNKQNSFISPLPNSLVKKNILARISIDYKKYDFGDVLVGNQFNGALLSDIRSYTGKADLQKLNVQIVNEWGEPVNLNGLDFSFTLAVEHE